MKTTSTLTPRQKAITKFCPKHGNYVDVPEMEMGCPECMDELTDSIFGSVVTKGEGQ